MEEVDAGEGAEEGVGAGQGEGRDGAKEGVMTEEVMTEEAKERVGIDGAKERVRRQEAWKRVYERLRTQLERVVERDGKVQPVTNLGNAGEEVGRWQDLVWNGGEGSEVSCGFCFFFNNEGDVRVLCMGVGLPPWVITVHPL